MRKNVCLDVLCAGDWNRSVSEVNLYITGLAATMTDDVLRAVFHEYA